MIKILIKKKIKFKKKKQKKLKVIQLLFFIYNQSNFDIIPLTLKLQYISSVSTINVSCNFLLVSRSGVFQGDD